ncbi:hypothetical protein QTP70_011624 [Hemibagrus guttatus]|uniref:Ig-like domain-containing protein n=1 Tax=Hemibagrus guttatus TaxID=175788 RepID=A0AAE0RDP3_9TELE|nr:hypothetical protein QTP70_011624 [Hemibagrus guttatus]
MSLPQTLQEVETLLGFLGDGAGVELPGEVLRQQESPAASLLLEESTSWITAWFGICTVSDRKILQWIVRTAEKIIGVSLPFIMDMYTTHCIHKANSIVDDPTHHSHTHPTHILFTLPPSGKRYQSLREFKLVHRADDVGKQSGSDGVHTAYAVYRRDVTLPGFLSPKKSAVAMEIRWFKETDCICLYQSRQVTEGNGYKGRVSLFTNELEEGNVSLMLRNVQSGDTGQYKCEVTCGDEKLETSVNLRLYRKPVCLCTGCCPNVHGGHSPVTSVPVPSPDK